MVSCAGDSVGGGISAFCQNGMNRLFPSRAVNNINQVETTRDLTTRRVNVQADTCNILVFHSSKKCLTDPVITGHAAIRAQTA